MPKTIPTMIVNINKIAPRWELFYSEPLSTQLFACLRQLAIPRHHSQPLQRSRQ